MGARVCGVSASITRTMMCARAGASVARRTCSTDCVATRVFQKHGVCSEIPLAMCSPERAIAINEFNERPRGKHLAIGGT
jgi:hypothetical protein